MNPTDFQTKITNLETQINRFKEHKFWYPSAAKIQTVFNQISTDLRKEASEAAFENLPQLKQKLNTLAEKIQPFNENIRNTSPFFDNGNVFTGILKLFASSIRNLFRHGVFKSSTAIYQDMRDNLSSLKYAIEEKETTEQRNQEQRLAREEFEKTYKDPWPTNYADMLSQPQALQNPEDLTQLTASITQFYQKQCPGWFSAKPPIHINLSITPANETSYTIKVSFLKGQQELATQKIERSFKQEANKPMTIQDSLLSDGKVNFSQVFYENR